jgi:hypothetical protein
MKLINGIFRAFDRLDAVIVCWMRDAQFRR